MAEVSHYTNLYILYVYELYTFEKTRPLLNNHGHTSAFSMEFPYFRSTSKRQGSTLNEAELKRRVLYRVEVK